MTTAKKYSATEKTRVVLEAIRGELTYAQITSKYGVHSTQINRWKQQALSAIETNFNGSQAKAVISQDELVAQLYQQIGKLTTECEWLKKNLSCLSNDKKRQLISNDNKLTIKRQSELINFNRSTYYYDPKSIDTEDLRILNLIDEIYTNHPYFGTRRMLKELEDC